MKENIKENKNIILWLEDGIIYALYKKNSIIDLQAAEEIVKLRESVSRGKALPMLADMRNIGNVTKQAREYLASEVACREIAKGALIIDSNFSKIIVSIFLKISKLKVLTKVFTDIAPAEKWLNEDFKKEHDKSLLEIINNL